MNIKELISAFSLSSLNEMSQSQARVIESMEGFCFQIAVHITKICNSKNLTDELRNKWVKDITKHCNLFHEKHLNNGRNPINFNKRGNYLSLIDHSIAKINSQIPKTIQQLTSAENEYIDFILRALKYSQANYNTLKPFTPGWVDQQLTEIGI